MEDAPLSTQVVMPSVTEDEDESVHSHSRNISQASSYVIVNDDSHVQTPLLQTDHSNDSTHELENPNAHVPPERWIYPTSGTVTVISQIFLNLQTLGAKPHLTLKLSAIQRLFGLHRENSAVSRPQTRYLWPQILNNQWCLRWRFHTLFPGRAEDPCSAV